MSAPFDVVAVVGSQRRESLTRGLLRGLIRVAPPSLRIEEIPLGTLPLYNQDHEGEPPRPWTEFRARVLRANAVLFATPEYNRSVPGALKNAIDVGSRPPGKSVWNGKPAALVSASPGAIGGFGANHHLRQSLVFLNMPTMQQPEAYIGGVDRLIDADGQFKDESTRAFLASFMSAFEHWISRFVG
ncbi:MAG TPA: NAD(P)H-dependent oxidoreductase [Burkholderiales bacterium]|nr:NAD(P)H-dependent oxidoreductase [Burkholderiales bacterium]